MDLRAGQPRGFTSLLRALLHTPSPDAMEAVENKLGKSLDALIADSRKTKGGKGGKVRDSSARASARAAARCNSCSEHAAGTAALCRPGQVRFLLLTGGIEGVRRSVTAVSAAGRCQGAPVCPPAPGKRYSCTPCARAWNPSLHACGNNPSSTPNACVLRSRPRRPPRRRPPR